MNPRKKSRKVCLTIFVPPFITYVTKEILAIVISIYYIAYQYRNTILIYRKCFITNQEKIKQLIYGIYHCRICRRYWLWPDTFFRIWFRDTFVAGLRHFFPY